jgi:GxxExxY protein
MKHEEITSRIIKVFYEVYNDLGYGFSEKIYERAMAIALADEGLKVESQKAMQVNFRGQLIGEYAADAMVDDAVIVEYKAATAIVEAHESQLLNYLKASDSEVGLILNFGPRPEIKRMVLDNELKKPSKRRKGKK